MYFTSYQSSSLLKLEINAIIGFAEKHILYVFVLQLIVKNMTIV